MSIIQLSPTVITLSSLLVFKDALTAVVILLLVCYLAIPYLYIKYLSKEKEITVYFLNEFQDRMNQIKIGISLFGSAFGLIFFSYFMMYEFKYNFLMMISFPVKYEALYLFVFALLISFVNPVLEEWFWRIFLQKTYRNSDNNKILLNINYTFFHFVLLCQIMDWKYAVGMMTNFFSIGRSFDYIKEKYGIITCMITHIGMSFASMLVLYDILFLGWKHH